MKKIMMIWGRTFETSDGLVVKDLPSVGAKVNELVEGYNQLLGEVKSLKIK